LRRSPLLFALIAALAQACSCDQVSDSAVTSCELSKLVPGPVKTDILFVIDDSGSMSEEQANLKANLATFIQALKTSPIANDFQIGVTTTSVTGFTGTAMTGVGDHGALIADVPAGTPAVLAGDRADLVNEFGQRVIVGTSGSGKEQPFRAMELALSDPTLLGGANAGFLRAGSRLAVVFLSDEDDCSDGDTDPNTPGEQPAATTNGQCHNDVTPFVDYKFSRIVSIDHYAGLLKGALGGQVHDVVLAAIVGVDPASKEPSCGYEVGTVNTNNWCCGGGNVAVCSPGIWSDVNGTYCAGGGVTLPDTSTCASGACCSGCPTAYDRGDRFAALLRKFPAEKTLLASVCDASFGQTLEQIAGLIVSQTMPLEGAPADYRMLLVSVRRADGVTVDSCTVQLAGTAAASDPATGAVYELPVGSAPAKLTFQNGCTLDRGDQIKIDLICAG
jgi:hypothetical protein